MPRQGQYSFAGGVIDPDLHSRFDLAKRNVSLADGVNIIIKPEGPAANRAGMTFIQEVKDSSDKTRLIPFAFNVEQQYALEFGDYYMRVIRNGSYVYEAAINITGITQANPGVVTTGSAHSYSTGDEIFLEDVLGMTDLNDRTFLVTVLSSTTFSIQDKLGNNIDTSSMSAYTSGGTVERVYEIETPYPKADLQLDPSDPTMPGIKFTQTADVMTVTHNNHSIKELTRTGHAAWTLTDKVTVPQADFPLLVSATNSGSGTNLDYKVTAVDKDTSEESLAGRSTTTETIAFISRANPCIVTVSGSSSCAVGDEIILTGIVGMTELNTKRVVVDAVSGGNITLRDVDSTSFTAYSSGGLVRFTYARVNGAQANESTISWSAATNAEKYNVYQRVNGLFGFVGSTSTTSFKLTNTNGDETDTPPTLRDPFDDTDEKPQATSYFEQRHVLGGSSGRPNGFDMSQSANFNNFTFSQPRRDNDAIARTISSRQVNEIRHFVPLSDLLVMTSGETWRVSAGDSDVITPASIVVKPQESYGSSHVRPIVSGSRALFVQSQGNIVRDMGYSLAKDGYAGEELSLLAKHFFRNHKIVEWAYHEVNDRLVLAVRDDGVLLCLTYLPEQEVWAWTQHVTRGKFESLCMVEEANEQYVYYIVKRTINGNTRRFIEKQASRDFFHDHDQMFLDAALTLDNPITITGVSNTNPVVITTATAHGLAEGDTIDLAEIKGSVVIDTDDDGDMQPKLIDELNIDGWHVGTVLSSTTFELRNDDDVDYDGTSLRTYEEGGEVRKAVTEVTGMWHLAGHRVRILANGEPVTGKTVGSDGKVSLDFPASRVHIGLPYQAHIETLDIVSEDEEGTTDSRRRRNNRLYLKVSKTRGVDVATVSDGKTSRFAAVKSTEKAVFSGTAGVAAPGRYGRVSGVCIRQKNPLAMTVLAVITDPEIEDGTD